MRILCITPYGKTKTPEMGFAELLSNNGHEITLLLTDYDISKLTIHEEILHKEFDVIWGMMEYAIPTAVTYGKLLNKPVLGHIECIPPWRISIEDNRQWGFDYPEGLGETVNVVNFKKMYLLLVNYFDKCDEKTISGDSWRYTFKGLTGIETDAKTRYYTFDKTDSEKYANSLLKMNKQICTISRFTPLKRVHHIIKALSLIPIENRPKYKLIGYGEQQIYLMRLAKELGVEVEFLGDGDNGLKYKTIQESAFNVEISSGIPVLEAASLNRFTLAYEEPHMKEVYRDICVWTERNNIEKLALEIEKHINNLSLCEELGREAKRKMLLVCDTSKFVADVEKYLLSAIENFNNKGGK